MCSPVRNLGFFEFAEVAVGGLEARNRGLAVLIGRSPSWLGACR